jgi:hypothetical protein
MNRGDYVLIYDNEHDRLHPGAKMVGSGIILEDYDIPNTFGRKMYIVSVNGETKTYDDAFYTFEVLSEALPNE